MESINNNNSNNSPYKTLSSKVIHKNPWLTIYVDDILEGKENNQGKTKNQDKQNQAKRQYTYISVANGVRVIAIDKQKNVYLNNEYRYPIKSSKIQAVAGKIEDHQNPIEAAKNELLEEQGIVANKWTSFGKISFEPSFLVHENECFLAQDLTFHKQNLESGEQIEVIKIPINKSIEMIMKGEITDSATITLLFKVKHLVDLNKL